jgi:hypothetical protein
MALRPSSPTPGVVVKTTSKPSCFEGILAESCKGQFGGGGSLAVFSYHYKVIHIIWVLLKKETLVFFTYRGTVGDSVLLSWGSVRGPWARVAVLLPPQCGHRISASKWRVTAKRWQEGAWATWQSNGAWGGLRCHVSAVHVGIGLHIEFDATLYAYNTRHIVH